MGLKLASSLAITSLFALTYALVFVVSVWFLPFSLFGLLIMIAFALIIVLIQYGISPYLIQWLYSIDWLSYQEYKARYPHLAETLDKVVSINKIKMPRLGIINDLNPNAFTFGHTKNNARVVLTTGILEFLNKEEQKGVMAHELGHVIHSDFVLMTIVFAIPLLLLTISRWAFFSARFSGRGKDSKEQGAVVAGLFAVAIASYIAYYIGYLISLIISRIREYYADEHAAEVLQNPNALSSGLVKIAYGLVADHGVSYEERNKSKTRALRGLGIFDPDAAKYFAAGSMTSSGSYSNETIAAAAAWDLYNPWAKYYQVKSTHPLPAKRIQRLNQQCPIYGKKPEIDLSQAKKIKEAQAGKSMMGEFLTDLFFKYLPMIVFILFLLFTIAWAVAFFTAITLPLFSSITIPQMLFVWGIGFYIIGFGFIIKTGFKYRSDFEPKTVLELITNVKVSPVRCIPAIIEGQIIGKGVPGYFISNDLYFKDKTGLLYVDYRFGLGIVDLFFALARANKLIGQKVKIKGWYRRGPNPYIQVDTIETVSGRRFRNYVKHMTYILVVLCFIIGLVFFYFWFTA
ncbi:MAG: M48 family metalloprotease [Candidatus Lokiarchaeota archaeon]|nr:M48 family metalloprotease [Candidatus Lokiarchaeota archaeon]